MIKKPLNKLQKLNKSELISLIENLQNPVSNKHIDNATLFNSDNSITNTFSVMTEGFISLDKNDQFVFINKKGLELINKDFDNLIGQNIWEVLKFKKSHLFYVNYYKAIETQSPITFENYSKTSKKWFKNRIIPSNYGVSIFYEDITNVKLSRKNIKDAYDILNRSTSVAFLWKNERNWPVEYVSTNVENIFEYTYSDFINHKISYGDIIHPDDLLQVRNEIKGALTRKKDESFTHKPYRIITKSGNIKWIIERNKLRFNEKGKITHFQGFIDDITERKKLEDTLQQVSNNTNNVVGENYLTKIALELQIALKSDQTYICFLSEPSKLTPLVSYRNGLIIDNIPYDIEYTPCYEAITKKQSCSYSKDVAILFPNDPFLAKTKVVGYVGVPLFNNNNKPIGIVTALYTNPIENEEFAKSIIQVYTNRISAEIQNSKSKALLKSQKEENRILFEEAATPTCILDLSIIKNEFDALKNNNINTVNNLFSTKDSVLSCIKNLKIIDINKKSREFLNSTKENKEKLPLNQNFKILDESIPFIRHCLVSLFENKTSFEGEIIITDDIGEKKYLIVKFTIPQVYQKTFSKALLSFTDITKRKIIEEIVFENKQRLEEHINNTPLASIVWDLDFKCLEWNKSAEIIFGYTAKEAKGKSAFDLIIPKRLQPKTDSLWNSLLNEKGKRKLSLENITKNGELIYCDWYNVLIKDINGTIISVASLANDITQQIKSKKLLRQSEKKYKDIFNKSNDAVFILDKYFRFIDCNNSAVNMFNYNSKAELLNQTPAELSPKIQPNGQISVQLEKGHLKKAIEFGSHRFTWFHKKSNGIIFPVDVSLTRILNTKNETSIHAVCRDITEREKKERIQNVLYNISNAALAIDNFHKFNEFIQKELSSIIDTTNFFIALYNKDQETISTPFMVDEQDTLRDFPAKKTLTEYVIKTKKSLLGTEADIMKLINKDIIEWVGPPCKIWLGVPLKINNEIIGVITIQSYKDQNAYTTEDVALLEFVSHNISVAIQRKGYEDKLKQALEKAKESDLLKSAFLANMSHEIRTPMNGIIGFSELLAEHNITEEDRHNYAKIVINSSNQLLSIVNDILDISQIEAGMISIKKETTSINEQLENLFQFFNQKATKKNIELNFTKSLISPFDIIITDQVKLTQILTNLLSNALKFTDKGTISYGYSVENSIMKFFVKDTGIGIKPEEQSKVFDRFTQADMKLNKRHRGNGLGLSICQKLVNLLGGKIWLESEYSVGSTFIFTIPYERNTKQKIEIKSIEIIDPILLESSITILVAEDEEYNRLYLNEIFSKTNHKIIEAVNGQQAIDFALQNTSIDLILMDIKMPILDGLDATREIKKVKPNLPIIAVSAYAMQSDISMALEAGCDDALSKPINRKKLMALINKYALRNSNSNITT